ncbi:unnamed protein product [Didymodactylos carnosus]|uniref:Uncharacterized protein n=2 Tax=Didymodactylos carnosus TaxID=1234261 RepID=A0A8S2KCX9_9BILA|nr:unnamed protein product [Didymodactylos carnosus]CAF3836142.1 unnamed protein product [Didymodactylos carnosus]
MVDVKLVYEIVQQQTDPTELTIRQEVDLNCTKVGETIQQHSTELDQLKDVVVQVVEEIEKKKSKEEESDDEDDMPLISYVKLKPSNDDVTPTKKKLLDNIKVSKSKDVREEDNKLDGASVIRRTREENIITNKQISKTLSPLFLQNMRSCGISSDWIMKRSTSYRKRYNASTVKRKTSTLDALIKDVSSKQIRSNRKLNFNDENVNLQRQRSISETPIFKHQNEDDEKKKEEEAVIATNEEAVITTKEEEEAVNATKEEAVITTKEEEEAVIATKEETPYDNVDETSKDASAQEFEVRPCKVVVKRVEVNENEQLEIAPPLTNKSKVSKKSLLNGKKKRTTKSKTSQENNDDDDDRLLITYVTPLKKEEKKNVDDSNNQIDHLKKLLRTSGIRLIVKKAELEQHPSIKDKIKYLKSLFEKAGYTGGLNMKECQRYREKCDGEKELADISERTTENIQGYVKAGRTLRKRNDSSPSLPVSSRKRKRILSDQESEDDDSNNGETKQKKKEVKIDLSLNENVQEKPVTQSDDVEQVL